MRPTLSLAISIFTMVALTSDVNGYNSSSISDASHSFNTAPDSTTIKDPVYVEVTIKQKAEFPGGDAALKKYIKKKYKVPSVAAELRGR